MANTAWICAPAYGLNSDACQALPGRLSPLCEALELLPALAPSASTAHADRCWWPLAQRREEIVQASDHDCWWAARGGYGCIHLVDALLECELPPLIGYSDLTIGHACGWIRGCRQGIYGPMPANPHGDRALISLANHWHHRSEHWAVTPLRPGTITAPLFPACLRVLAGLIGTPAQPDLAGAILAIEDIDERPYAVDRCLEQLARSGALDGIVGLVFGMFPYQRPPGTDEPEMADILAAWTDRIAVPTISNVPFGHLADPIALPVGGNATITCSADTATLTVTR